MKATTAIIINKPIQEIWNFVSKIENMDQWVDGVSEPRLNANGEMGIGTTFTSKYTYGGKTHTIDYEVNIFEPPYRFGTRSTEGPFPFDGLIELKKIGDNQTEIRNTIEAGSDHFITTVIFTLFRPFIRRMMARQLHKELEILKRKLE